ncbi:MAG: NAD-dependent succinate-semialdehyde dehydrogenase [Prolixibacteraceae bacterium]|nr:NAD-dependent succinate-semialdehyde dehydrogenase [Prolixibacteraceae bacterium]MBN2650351.1 NAD-dependent succinate-semialdehyde dehydrogenase [Prolixibacteraceae bacterium]
MRSINPYNKQLIAEYTEFTADETKAVIDAGFKAWNNWKSTGFDYRAQLMHRAAGVLREKKASLAKLICNEMGKRIAEAEAEIEKCAWVCDYYAEKAPAMLADEPIATDGLKSMAIFQPIGPVLAVMPWNYPFWQVFRFAAPALMAGNTGLLKHASNVQGCALAIENIFTEAGFPENVFRSLIIGSSQVEAVIANPKVKAVTLTGSEYAGSKVAAAAGKHLKKAVLELGGSDPCIVLDDANLDEAAQIGIQSRMLTSGQTCIAAKRFIVHEKVAGIFLEKVKAELEKYQPGDPMNRATMLAPLAKRNFVEDVHRQVSESVKMGAKIETGGTLPNDKSSCFYPATLITNVNHNMPVFYEETFGPVVAFVVVKDEKEAIQTANDSLFGLGAAIWTNDEQRSENIARKIEAGAVFVNGLVKSDPRLPFGGVKNSGFGRELSHYGIKEFCNIKSMWIK